MEIIHSDPKSGVVVASLDNLVDSLTKPTEETKEKCRAFIERLNAGETVEIADAEALEPALERMWADWRKFLGCGAKMHAPSDTLYSIAEEGGVKLTAKMKDIPARVKSWVNQPDPKKRAAALRSKNWTGETEAPKKRARKE